ncbi:MAG: GNAT family N-acetyltransferase [Oricola sp.]
MITISAAEGDAKAFEDALDRLLDDHAEAIGTPFNARDINLQATDEAGVFLGGLRGYSQLGWLFVQYLALAPAGRGQGVGRRLMEEAEAIARERGLAGIWVDTYEFQAPDFYAKLGYTEYGRLPAVVSHPQRIWFCKVLTVDGA